MIVCFCRRHITLLTLGLCLGATGARAQALQRGMVIDGSSAPMTPAQRAKALYLPSSYAPERTWSLLLAFHPAARGRAMVEKYQAAAENTAISWRPPTTRGTVHAGVGRERPGDDAPT